MTQVRVRRAEQHLQSTHRSELERTQVGDDQSGFIGWRPTDSAVDWDFFSKRGGAGTAWLHVPSKAGGPESGVDPWLLADDIFNGRIQQGELGAPFVVARWRAGQLEIINDMLGLVRLFHYEFEGGDVWSTRQGLAHVFIGEEPRRNPLAWAGMATLGWSAGGETQLGQGKQILGGSYVRAGIGPGGRFVESRNTFGEWLETSRSRKQRPASEYLRDMETLMSTANRWPEMAIADLSGGKDSRVCAAIGIRARAVSAVRTVNTDRGEVATATRLMKDVDGIPHIIEEKKSRVVPGGHFFDRIYSQHHAYEGRFLATTAVNASSFTGFSSAKRARFNGLGGEVLGGGNFASGTWRERVIGAPNAEAIARLKVKIRLSKAASSSAIAILDSQVESFVDQSEGIGASSAGEVLDLFYARDCMPNWSIPFASENIVCPLFAPSVLTLAPRTMGAPVPNGELHRELIRAAKPSWKDVPFYSPVTKNRSFPFIWEESDWGQIESFVRERVDGADAFDSAGTVQILDRVRAGDQLGKPEEVAISRFLWDQTFDAYVEQVAEEVRSVKAEIEAAMSVERH